MTAISPKRRARVQAKPERVRDAPRAPFVGLFDWRSSNPHLFPSDTSLRWHLRRYREEYVAAGALLEIAGRLVVDPRKFESVLREVGARAAAERGTEPEAA
jgi:hypothetical protein